MPDNSQKIKRAKQIQAPLSYTSGAMGVAGLGALALKKKSPTANKVYAPLTTASVGVGSVGSFNFARLQGLEAKHTPPRQRSTRNVYYVRNKKQIEQIKAQNKVSKAQKKKRDYSGAMVGVGAPVAATGLVGGGIPGARPNSGRLNMARGGKGTKTEVTRHIVSATRGGIFGYREDAHRRFLNDQRRRLQPWKPNGDKGNAFERGRELGRTIPERKIIRHMKAGRTASNVGFAGGAALLGGGLYLRKKNKQKVSKAKRNEDYKFKSDAMIAGGTTTAAGSYLGAKALDSQGKKWAKQAETTIRRSHAINPKTGGVDVVEPKKRGAIKTIRSAQSRVPDVRAHRSTDDIKWNGNDVFSGRTFKEAKKTGQLRGIASQSRYFANTYGNNAKAIRRLGIPAGIALTGAGVAHRKYEFKPRKVSKALDTSGGTMDFGLSSVHQGVNISKAYNPEDRRHRRSERVTNTQPYVTGAAGAGAGIYGYKSIRAGRSAVGDFRSAAANEVVRTRLVNEAQNFKTSGSPKSKSGKTLVGAARETAMKESGRKYWKKAALHPGGSPKMAEGFKSAKVAGRNAGIATGLTAVAIGAKLGSDRIKSYNAKKGRTYRPLHRNVS